VRSVCKTLGSVPFQKGEREREGGRGREGREREIERSFQHGKVLVRALFLTGR
jgi:hypothetical protein